MLQVNVLPITKPTRYMVVSILIALLGLLLNIAHPKRCNFRSFWNPALVEDTNLGAAAEEVALSGLSAEDASKVARRVGLIDDFWG